MSLNTFDNFDSESDFESSSYFNEDTTDLINNIYSNYNSQSQNGGNDEEKQIAKETIKNTKETGIHILQSIDKDYYKSIDDFFTQIILFPLTLGQGRIINEESAFESAKLINKLTLRGTLGHFKFINIFLFANIVLIILHV